MDAPLLLALARGFCRLGEVSAQSLWVSPRALALQWAPERRAGLGPGHVWVLLLSPSPELWLLKEGDPAHAFLKAEARHELTRRWGLELKGARLVEAEGDPRERRLALTFRRRAVTGRIEATRLAFQAIPGRAGLRLDGLDLNATRIGLGCPFAPEPPEPEPDTPPFRRFRERLGEAWEAALRGACDAVLEGEGSLLERHLAWSRARAEKLILAPKAAAVDRRLLEERKRLERYGAALAEDRARHLRHLALKEPAAKLGAELWRLKGRTGTLLLEDGSALALPEGQRAEETVQRWFAAAKKAERGLARVALLERERERQLLELQARLETPAEAPAPPRKAPHPTKRKPMKEERQDRRADGKGKAHRSLMIEGMEVLIGKGDADNDALTFKVASPLDFWLHVAGVPGSHVVIRNPDRISEPPRPVLERAAELAAFYSKARDGGKVEVHWCRVADVSKPRGFPAGKVILKTWKAVRVYPKA